MTNHDFIDYILGMDVHEHVMRCVEIKRVGDVKTIHGSDMQR